MVKLYCLVASALPLTPEWLAAILIVVLGALVGALVTKYLTPDYTRQIESLSNQLQKRNNELASAHQQLNDTHRELAQSQARLTDLESDRYAREEFEKLPIDCKIEGLPPEQRHILVVAPVEVRIGDVDALDAQDARFGTIPNDAVGSTIRIPIPDKLLIELWNARGGPANGHCNATMSFSLASAQYKRKMRVPVHLSQDFIQVNGTTTVCIVVRG